MQPHDGFGGGGQHVGSGSGSQPHVSLGLGSTSSTLVLQIGGLAGSHCSLTHTFGGGCLGCWITFSMISCGCGLITV